MPVVLDASAAGSFIMSDEQGHPIVAALLRQLGRQRFLVPQLWWFEVRSIILVGEVRGRLSERQSQESFDALDALPVDCDRLPDQADVLLLARRHRLTFYDATYLELAVRERAVLATLDSALMKAARVEQVSLLA